MCCDDLQRVCCQNDEDMFLNLHVCDDLQCVCCQNDEDVFLIACVVRI